MAANKKRLKEMIIGIDATNLRRGGGITHLIELLSAADPEKHAISRIVIWGGWQLLEKLPERTWLEKINPVALNRGLFRRTWWQRFSLSKAACAAGCDLLFVPGGSYAGNFKPFVIMSRNLLPFEWKELRRYRWSLLGFKLLLLRFIQSHSFRRADGVIFLTEYARESVLKVVGKNLGKTVTIPHGINPRFKMQPKAQRSPDEYTAQSPCRLIYISIIDQYKHQWHVVEAVHSLRAEGVHVKLDLVGPAYPPALRRLHDTIARLDPKLSWVQYHGAVPYESLHQLYAMADIGIFASSCENMPNILVETMAAGLPVACSNRGPMPEVLGNAGVYFDPEQSASIYKAIRKLIVSPSLRTEKALESYELAQHFSWDSCATKTFDFLEKTLFKHS